MEEGQVTIANRIDGLNTQFELRERERESSAFVWRRQILVAQGEIN